MSVLFAARMIAAMFASDGAAGPRCDIEAHAVVESIDAARTNRRRVEVTSILRRHETGNTRHETRDNETTRQRDSETERQRDSETARQRDSETARQRDSETGRQGDSETLNTRPET